MLKDDVGSPASVVLLPALGEPASSLFGLAAELELQGLPASIVDRRPADRFEDHLGAARSVLATVDSGAPHLLVGASYGGMIAGVLACEADSLGIGGLVMLDSPHPLSHPTIRAFVGARADLELPNPEGVDLQAALTAVASHLQPGALRALPLLVLSRGPGTWPGDDPDLPTADRIWLAHQSLHRQLSELSTGLVLSEVGHQMGTTHPRLVADIIARWRRHVAETQGSSTGCDDYPQGVVHIGGPRVRPSAIAWGHRPSALAANREETPG